MPLGRASATAPTWALYALRLQVGLVYFFAGLAKLRGDWLLHAQPLKLWLAPHADFPLLGPLFARPGTAHVMSWAGAAFDLGVPFLLLHRRCRPYAFAALLGFHGLTGALFPIGMFPWIMSCAALIFFPPDWPRRLLRALGRPVPADISHVPTGASPSPPSPCTSARSCSSRCATTSTAATTAGTSRAFASPGT